LTGGGGESPGPMVMQRERAKTIYGRCAAAKIEGKWVLGAGGKRVVGRPSSNVTIHEKRGIPLRMSWGGNGGKRDWVKGLFQGEEKRAGKRGGKGRERGSKPVELRGKPWWAAGVFATSGRIDFFRVKTKNRIMGGEEKWRPCYQKGKYGRRKKS